MGQGRRESKFYLFTLCCLLIPTGIFSQEVLQWRGADRRGLYHETGLLQSWPEEGPELLWEFADLGNGYSSPVITAHRIYVNGEIDTVTYLFALDRSGNFIWKTPVGKEWTINYPGSRSTPTVVEELIYLSTGLGTVACLEAKAGKVRWSHDMPQDFHAPLTRFGFSESLLVEGNTVYCTPGNPDTNVVALDRFTGKIQWICKGLGEHTAYCSPMLIQLPERNILVTFTAHALLGIDTKDGTEITEVWRNKACDNTMGGFIKLDNYIYTASYEKRQWYIQDATTGLNADSVKFDKGATIFADGRLYLYNERGHLGLFKADGPKMEMISSFKITHGTKAHYAHPVIFNGRKETLHGGRL
ncbi:MAG: PQQ-binding-like beta-propeller repeat protein [Bacteroidota bacterium]